MGSNSLKGSLEQTDAGPEHQVTLSSYSLSEAEVTNAQYVAFLNAAYNEGIIVVVEGVQGQDKGKVIVIGNEGTTFTNEI